MNDTFAPDTGETLTITTVATPVHGTATTNGSKVTYTPVANYNGPDSFSYTISDGNGGTDSGVGENGLFSQKFLFGTRKTVKTVNFSWRPLAPR